LITQQPNRIGRLRDDDISEQIELSRLAEVVDSADGGVMALTAVDFERVKYLVNKGRGKTIVTH
jgi:hypothetical protein